MRYVYFDISHFLAPHLPPDAVAALLAACQAPGSMAAVAAAAQLAAAAAATLNMSDSESDDGEAPRYQANHWSLLPSLQAQLLVLDGSDQRALHEAGHLIQVSPATCCLPHYGCMQVNGTMLTCARTHVTVIPPRVHCCPCPCLLL